MGPRTEIIFFNFPVFRLELYMVAFKLIQKYKISYDGPEIGIDYIGNNLVSFWDLKG